MFLGARALLRRSRNASICCGREDPQPVHTSTGRREGREGRNEGRNEGREEGGKVRKGGREGGKEAREGGGK